MVVRHVFLGICFFRSSTIIVPYTIEAATLLIYLDWKMHVFAKIFHANTFAKLLDDDE